MSEPDIQSRFDRMRGALTPLDDASPVIERAVARRRRRPLVISGSVTGVAGIALLAVALPGALVTGSESTASLTTPAPAPSSVNLSPAALTGETVGDWVEAADVVVLVTTSGADTTAEVVDVSWRRTEQPGSPAATFAIEALALDDDGGLDLATAQGARAEVTLTQDSEYLTALRWEQVRCDGEAPGWVLLGDEAVLPYEDAVVGSDDGATLALGAPVTSAFAGLTATEVAHILDELVAQPDTSRTQGLCH